jgi:hypothetical protein
MSFASSLFSMYSYLKLPILSEPVSITLFSESTNINATSIISAPRNAPKNTTKLLPGLESMLLTANLFLTFPFFPTITCLLLLSSATPFNIATVSFLSSLFTLPIALSTYISVGTIIPSSAIGIGSTNLTGIGS